MIENSLSFLCDLGGKQIMIHKFRQNGVNIVMDVNSGAVHLVEPVLYEALDFYDGKECRKQELFDVLSARYRERDT